MKDFVVSCRPSRVQRLSSKVKKYKGKLLGVVNWIRRATRQDVKLSSTYKLFMITSEPQDVQNNLSHTKSSRMSESEEPIPEDISFPFMDLPAELRLHIYSYLMPNTNINTCQDYVKSTVFPGKFYSYWPIQLRHDCKPCCPSLLRTNRQIYHEMVELWYSSLCIGSASATTNFDS